MIYKIYFFFISNMLNYIYIYVMKAIIYELITIILILIIF